uniref:ATP-binding cassette domain-containing protein n=1 Tax=Actinotalea sp. TaxID=1872145 RepID=UPI0035624FCB
RLGLDELAGRRPRELSGGQAQRVALARALAADPAVLLLDEPMAALDARTRVEIRSVLREVLAGFDGPTVLVVHDPLEAMVLADRILVIENGRAVQEGTPSEVARRPATDYVARLVGLNLYRGTLADPGSRQVELDGGGRLVAAGGGPTDLDLGALAAGAPVLVAVRPMSIAVHTREPDHGSVRNVWAGRVSAMDLLADRVRLSVDGEIDAAVDVTPAAVADLGLADGVRVWLSVKATDVTGYSAP